jgi:hypothetical protein
MVARAALAIKGEGAVNRLAIVICKPGECVIKGRERVPVDRRKDHKVELDKRRGGIGTSERNRLIED